MTDARLPERWLNDRRFLRLSPEAWQLYTRALVYAVANRTDGVLFDDDLPLIPGVDLGRVPDLGLAEVWQRGEGWWLIVDFEETQTSRDELEKLDGWRRAARDRQRKHRALSRDSHSDSSRDPNRTGQDKAKAHLEGELAGTSERLNGYGR